MGARHNTKGLSLTPSELERLYLAHGARLIAFARNLAATEQDAEDIVQGVFVNMVRSSVNGATLRDARAYLFTACRNEAIKLAKKQRREWIKRRGRTGDNIVLEAENARSPEWEEMCEIVASAMRRLPAEQREVLHLKIFEDMSFSEIGTILGISRDTAASRYRYGLTKMARSLERWKDKI